MFLSVTCSYDKTRVFSNKASFVQFCILFVCVFKYVKTFCLVLALIL